MQVVAVTDPVSLGDRRVALGRVCASRPTPTPSPHGWVELAEVEYLVATAGRFDLMFEVIVDDEPHLLSLLSTIRSHADIAEVEAFPCLKLYKQTFAWGT